MRERAARRRARPASALTVLVAGVALSVAAVPASGAPPAARAAPGAAARPARRCAVNLAGELASTGPARQLVTVVAKDPRSTYADVTTWQRRDGCWVRAAGPFAARVGVSGISQHKVEGDGTTPAGIFGVGPVMYGNAANPGVHYPYHRLVCGDWWDEVPSSRWYNSFRHVACGSRPSWTYGELRGALDGDDGLWELRLDRVQHRPRRARAGLGHLPARRLHPCHRRLREPASR